MFLVNSRSIVHQRRRDFGTFAISKPKHVCTRITSHQETFQLFLQFSKPRSRNHQPTIVHEVMNEHLIGRKMPCGIKMLHLLVLHYCLLADDPNFKVSLALLQQRLPANTLVQNNLKQNLQGNLIDCLVPDATPQCNILL